MTATRGKPLAGRRILVTRRPGQALALAARLAELGATVLEVATIEIAPPEDLSPLDRALRALSLYDWVVFTSANAVAAVAERSSALGIDAGVLGRTLPVASVGASTTDAFLRRFPGGEVSLEPESTFSADGLAQAFASRSIAGLRFLLPTSSRARDILAAALRACGADVDVVVAYRTTAPAGLQERLGALLRAGMDLATFASPSAVENFTSAVPELVQGLPAAVIGPATENAARKAGMDVRVIASPSTGDGLVSALLRHFAG